MGAGHAWQTTEKASVVQHSEQGTAGDVGVLEALEANGHLGPSPGQVWDSLSLNLGPSPVSMLIWPAGLG